MDVMSMKFLLYSNRLTYSIFGITLIQSILICSFTWKEIQQYNALIDLEVSRENRRLKTTLHRKPTFSSVYTHFDRFLPATYKFSMIYTLAYTCIKIFSNWTLFHNDLQQLKHIFCKNVYPENFIGSWCKKFVEDIYVIK